MWQTLGIHVLNTKKKLKINLNWLWHSVSNYAFKARYPATPFLLALDYSVVHKIVAIIPAEFDFNMFIKFHTYILTYTKNPQAFVFLDIKQALKK